MVSKDKDHGRIVSVPEDSRCLDSIQLHCLEQSFRQWADDSPRPDVRLSRRRMVIIFLLIRYTGAKLSEVLALSPVEDFDPHGYTVVFHSAGPDRTDKSRKVQISESLSREIRDALSQPFFQNGLQRPFDVDPGFIRRKFYERTQACGFPKEMGGPEMIRKGRAVELMQGNLPLPAVQEMLGHSTPNLTSAYVSFSADDIRKVTRLFIDREASRKTSARNSFFGKIQMIRRGDIQARVTLTTVSGNSVVTVITNDSLDQLALRKGRLITAEVKAPWVMLFSGETEPRCSAENRFGGIIERIAGGGVNSEYTVRIADGTLLCAIVSTQSARQLALEPGDRVWALFNCFAVVLHID